MENRSLHRPLSPNFLRIEHVMYEPDVFTFPRAQEIRDRFLDAEYREIQSRESERDFSGNAGRSERWIENKRSTLFLATHRSMSTTYNGRSAHWTLPEQSSGCAMACTYCTVHRSHGYAKPITAFVDIERLLRYLEGHARRQGMLTRPDQIDDRYWVYNIGETSDCSVDALISDNVWDLVRLFRRLPNAKGCFATKFVNPNLLRYDPQQKTRMCFSLMPESIARAVDLRTDPIEARILAINDFYDAGYEVHVRFAPVIIYDGWIEAYQELFAQMQDLIKPRILQTLAAEIEFLSHATALHEVNMSWHAIGEALLWTPQWQEAVDAGRNDGQVRYKSIISRSVVQSLLNAIQKILPMVRVRYVL